MWYVDRSQTEDKRTSQPKKKKKKGLDWVDVFLSLAVCALDLPRMLLLLFVLT